MLEINHYSEGDRINHKVFGKGRIISIESENESVKWSVQFRDGIKKIVPAPDQLIELPLGNNLNYEDIKRAVREVFSEEIAFGEVPLGEKWTGGKVIMIPGRPELQQKEVPMEAFFHKIVMLRDNLRVLEQKINSHELLDDAEKVNLHQYITKIYGTLTTFNALFRDRKDYFVGHKGIE